MNPLLLFVKIKNRQKLVFFFLMFFMSFNGFFYAIDSSAESALAKDNTSSESQEKIDILPFWPKETFEWTYDASQEPPWLDKDEGLLLFKNAALAWKDCGPKIQYSPNLEGYSPISGDHVNTFGWGILNRPIRAMTYRAMKKNSPIIKESDILVNVLNADIQKDSVLLQKVITHEFGHALGLLHPLTCNDVMSNASECGKRIANPPPLIPTEQDLNQCRARYKALP